MFLEIWQYSQENTCTKVSFSIRSATLLKKRLCHRCFPVNFAKFLRTPFLQNTSWRLLLQYVLWFWDQFYKKNHLLGKALKSPLFCSPFFWLKTCFFNEKKLKHWLQFLTSVLNWCQLVNWLYISCKVTRKKKSAVNKWVTLMIGKIIRKSIKKFITWFFGKRSCFTKSSKQGGCYLVLLKVQYRSSHFWILWKTLSLDYRPKGKRIILKSKNLYNLLI